MTLSHEPLSATTEKKMTIISAPGKVLMTGGYLVLDRSYSPGLVLTTTSRFFTQVESLGHCDDTATYVVDLISPQFHSTCRYAIVQNEKTADWQLQCQAVRNPYIEDALLFTVAIADRFGVQNGKHLRKHLKVRIMADNDFYSQRENLNRLDLPVNLASLESLERFYCSPEDQSIHKTGLGSSAALVTSLVAAVLVHYDIVQIDDNASLGEHDNAREFVHRIAQFSHCLSQGKIGSGFDVSSACFGSQKYTRFSPQILNAVLEKSVHKPRECEMSVLHELVETLELGVLHEGPQDATESQIWDHRREAFNLPPNFFLFVGDVDQGSNTPSLVSRVLKWREVNKEQSNELWNRIRSLNGQVERKFEHLAQIAQEHEDQYEKVLSLLCNKTSDVWEDSLGSLSQCDISRDIVLCMTDLRNTFHKVREGMKTMGELAGVHIEPPEQTSLVDATMDVEGCLLGGVPGAGGYDAIFCVLFAGSDEESATVRRRVQNVWTQYDKASVTPLLLSESRDHGIRTHIEDELL